jgi:hypothetical protein
MFFPCPKEEDYEANGNANAKGRDPKNPLAANWFCSLCIISWTVSLPCFAGAYELRQWFQSKGQE